MKLASKAVIWRSVLTDQDAQLKFDQLTTYDEKSTAGKPGDLKEDTRELSDIELGALIALVESAPGFPGDDLSELNGELTARTFPKVFDGLDAEVEDQPATGSLSPLVSIDMPSPPPDAPELTPVKPKPLVVKKVTPRGTLVERLEIENERAKKLLEAGLADLGGEGGTWPERAKEIGEWFDGVKREEGADGSTMQEQWKALYEADRMTIRQVDPFSVRGQTFPVPRQHGEPKNQTIRLANRALDIGPRQIPANFTLGIGGKTRKDELGLHDLSGHLLDHSLPILGQLKGYSNALAIFMPVASERDARILFALAVLAVQEKAPEDQAKSRDELRWIRARMTRIKLAQGSDMHTSFIDIGESADRPMFRYGLTGTVTPARGKSSVVVDNADIAKRRHDAIEFSKILGDGATENANEIVLAYRKHESGRFPVYAEWDDKDRVFHVVTLADNPDFAAYERKVEEIREALGKYVDELPEGTVLSDSQIPSHLKEPTDKDRVSRYVATRTGDTISTNGKWTPAKD